MSSSIGSDAFAIIAFILIALAVLLLLRHYLPLRSSPAYLLFPVFLSLALPASIVLLVPIDIASSATTEDEKAKGIWLPERALLVAWRISYWLTFMLTWFILPFLGDFMDAGYREPKERMIYSLRSNARYQMIVLGCGIAGLVYIIIDYGFDLTAVKGLVVALAYVWGLFLAIYLMGHGLVAVPRRLFRAADISGSLRRLQSHAPKAYEKLEEAISKHEELEAQVVQLQSRKTGTARDYQEWIEELADLTSLPENRASTVSGASSAAKIPAVITDRYLADLSRRLGQVRHQRARRIDEWDYLVQRAADLQAILDSKASKKLSFGRVSPQASRLEQMTFLTPYMRYHVHVHLFPALRILLGGLASLASVCIIWSEIIKFPAPQLSAVSLTVVHHPSQKEDYKVGFGGQLTAAVWMLYMSTCALVSINDVPVWGNRALVRRNTYSEHACWYAGQIAKLTVPLAYNFLTFLPTSIHQNTVFYHFLGRLIKLTPLGKGFDFIFPIFILLPVCATLFNLYRRVKDIFGFGFGILEDEDEEDNPSGYGTGGWREGRTLIDRELQGSSGTASSSTLGLSPRPSTDINRTRAAPTLYVPPAERRSGASPSRLSPSRPSQPRNREPALDPEPPEENFFTLFGRRVKNTIDTIDTPKWMTKDSGNGGGGSGGPAFKRPKWMGGNDNNNEGRSNSFGGRLFGGQNSSGQVRL